MGKTSYCKKWEESYPWLCNVKTDKHLAYCKICLKNFRIDNSGLSQIKSHEKSHKPGQTFSKQRTFEIRQKNVSLSSNALVLSPEDKVVKAEIIQALHIVNKNLSFASARDDSRRFQEMFEESPIAKAYSMGETKAQYVVKFGIADFLEKKLIYDVKETPFSFLFDESTNNQVQKQYDAYVSYWSERYDQVISSYAGSLFVGHCNADDLVEHYNEFVRKLEIESDYLLHLGMDGPNVNRSFEKKLDSNLKNLDTTFLRLGSCSLHPTHTAFRKGIKELYSCPIDQSSFDLDDLFNDLDFFFKLSSARREDYASLENITNVVALYVKKHAETRWLSMKYVALCCLKQWPNLKEYFLKFLPRQSNFKSEISKTYRYKKIKTALENPITEAYISFCAFAAHDFESFLLPLQTGEPMIHQLYPSMCKLVTTLQSKFIRKKKMSSDFTANVHINVGKKENQKPLNLLDIGTKAKLLFADPGLISDDDQTKFRKDCLNFYATAVQYLQEKLPFDIPLLKQYIHPEKRQLPGATSAISNMSLSICSVLKTRLANVFNVKSPVTSEEVVNMIRNQWLVYQNEILKEEWYKNDLECSQNSRTQPSYWQKVESDCSLVSHDVPSYYKRIDVYWRHIGNLRDEMGILKYPQLFAMVKCVLSLSHGNSTPERGFSINKLMLEAHGYTIYKDTIVALRRVKDELNRAGGLMKFKISRDLIREVKLSYTKYEADRKARKAIKEAEEAERKKKSEEQTKKLEQDKEMESIDAEIEKCKSSLKVADDIIEDARGNLQKALAGGSNVDRSLAQQALSKIEIGTDRKRKFESDMEDLEKRKKEVSK